MTPEMKVMFQVPTMIKTMMMLVHQAYIDSDYDSSEVEIEKNSQINHRHQR